MHGEKRTIQIGAELIGKRALAGTSVTPKKEASGSVGGHVAQEDPNIIQTEDVVGIAIGRVVGRLVVTLSSDFVGKSSETRELIKLMVDNLHLEVLLRKCSGSGLTWQVRRLVEQDGQ